MQSIKHIIILGLAAGAAASAEAHALWVGSNRLLLDDAGMGGKPAKAVLYTGWGHQLPIDETLSAERFGGIALVAPDGTRTTVSTAADGYHTAEVQFDQAGAWWAVSESKPAFSTRAKRSNDEVVYIPLAKDALPTGTRAIETNYIRVFAKTLIGVAGQNASTAQAVKPLGHELEIVPMVSPLTVQAGGRLPVAVWFRGQPYQGDPIEIVAEHVAAPYVGPAGKWVGETDAQGRVDLPLGLPGGWMLLVTVFEPATGELAAKADQTRYRATLTFAVPEVAK